MPFKDIHRSMFGDGTQIDVDKIDPVELLDAYMEDISAADAKIADQTTTLAQREAEIAAERAAFNTERQALKARNYDLMTRVPALDESGNMVDASVIEHGDPDEAVTGFDPDFLRG